MKITHNNKTYIDAATHAGLRCWVTQDFVKAGEKSGWFGPMGDYAKDELIRYAHDPDGYRNRYILVTDAEDHRKHWPLRNTHRHPLEDVGDGGAGAAAREGTPEGAGFDSPVSTKPAPQPVDGGEWPKYALARALDYGGVEFQQLCVFQDARTADLYFCPKSTLGFSGNKSLGRQFDWRCETGGADLPGLTYQWGVTPTQAAEWLRNNGHEAVAAEIEGDRFEPVGTLPVVGDRVLVKDTVRMITEIVGCKIWQDTGYHLHPSSFEPGGTARILKRRAAK